MLKGNIFVYNTNGYVYVKAENCADKGTLTHNIFGNEHEARTSKCHDDHYAAAREGSGEVDVDSGAVIPAPFQHGVQIAAATDDEPAYGAYRMKLGLEYGEFNPNGKVTIEPGAWLRIGFRGAAWTIVPIPPADEVVVIPYSRLTFYNGAECGGHVEPQLKSARAGDVAALMLAAKGGRGVAAAAHEAREAETEWSHATPSLLSATGSIMPEVRLSLSAPANFAVKAYAEQHDHNLEIIVDAHAPKGTKADAKSVISNVTVAVPAPMSGDFTVVVRDRSGNELSRFQHAFT